MQVVHVHAQTHARMDAIQMDHANVLMHAKMDVILMALANAQFVFPT